MALAQALSSYPSFAKDKTAMENILAFERVEKFETISCSKYPDELKTGTLIRCCDAKLREHLQVTISDKTTYSEIKQSILGHDQATKTWASEQVIKSLEMKPHDPNGPQPMEVDSVNRIEDYTSKGKGKYKGKNKGKHGGWIPWQPYGRGKGGLKGKSKGKSKGKEQRKTRQRQEP